MNDVEVALLPFWRYAVGPINQCTPCIPFYRRKSADRLFARAVEKGFGVVMYKKIQGEAILIKQYSP